jgi:hypothetical protein
MIDVLGQIIRFPGIPAFEWVGESHEARVFPSWNRRGGCAIKKKTASEAAQTGWSVVTKCFAMHFCNILRN